METAALVLFGPAALITLSSLSLHNFNVMWRAFAAAASTRSGSAAWKAVQPALKQLAVVLENVLGSPPDRMKFNMTHVLLVGVIIAVMVAGERIRAAVLRKK